MEIYRYLNVLRKHLAVIVLLSALGGGSAYWFSSRQHPVYKATATLLINAAAPSSLIPYLSSATSNYGSMDALATTYGVFLQSRSFDRMVVQKLHLGVSPEELGGAISSALIPNTNYWTISVTWDNPAQAIALANGVARVFVQQNAAVQAAMQSNGGTSQINQALSYFKKKINTLQAQHDALLKNAKASQDQISRIEDELSNVEDTYYKLLGSAGTSGAVASTNSATFTDPAIGAESLGVHSKRNALAGVLGGFLLGLALAFLLDYLDYSLRTPEDVAELVGQTPLGVVARIEATQRKDRSARFGRRASHTAVAPTSNGNGHAPGDDAAALAALSPQLVSLHNPKAASSEAFRALRTNLDFSTLDKPLKTLVVTSPLPSEGKSTVAANLAISMAQAGKRVILVDADLRRPAVAGLFNLHQSTGLTSVLLSREDRTAALDEALQRTAVSDLLVMASGPHPPNPAELLASESMKSLQGDLEARADLVIFDTPPMGPFTDAVILAARASGTLLVVRAGSNRRALITNSLGALRKVGGTVVGTVLNMVEAKDLGNSSSSYYYYAPESYTLANAKATGNGRASA